MPPETQEADEFHDVEAETVDAAPATARAFASDLVLTEGCVKVLTDIIEEKANSIVMTRAARAEQHAVLTVRRDADPTFARQISHTLFQYFFAQHPARFVEFGRLYVKKELADFVILFVNADAYGGESDRPLKAWGVQDWEGVLQRIKALGQLLLRKDATVLVEGLTPEKIFEPMPEVNEALAQTSEFAKRFETLLSCIEVNAALAPIRGALEQWLLTDEVEDEPDIEGDELVRIWYVMMFFTILVAFADSLKARHQGHTAGKKSRGH